MPTTSPAAPAPSLGSALLYAGESAFTELKTGEGWPQHLAVRIALRGVASPGTKLLILLAIRRIWLALEGDAGEPVVALAVLRTGLRGPLLSGGGPLSVVGSGHQQREQHKPNSPQPGSSHPHRRSLAHGVQLGEGLNPCPGIRPRQGARPANLWCEGHLRESAFPVPAATPPRQRRTCLAG